jgi:hypothetical protein
MFPPERIDVQLPVRDSAHAAPDSRATDRINIPIEFVYTPQIEPTIKTRSSMKKNSVSPARMAPKIPAQSVSAGIGIEQLSPPAPFADLMLHPEKLDAILKAGPLQIPEPSNTVTPSARLAENQPAGKSVATKSKKSPEKTARFHLQTQAKSVQIAGDFNDWGKSPINMVPDGNGQWSAVVPLKPGQYAYRFIVDGKWCDDPNCNQRVANGFGSENSLIKVG